MDLRFRYWIDACSTVAAITISIAINIFTSSGSADTFSDKHQRQFKFAVQVFGATNPTWFVIQVAFTYAHFFYLIVIVCQGSDYHGRSGFEKFMGIYAMWLNSGTVSVLCIWLSNMFVMRLCAERYFFVFHEERDQEQDWGKKIGVLHEEVMAIMLPLALLFPPSEDEEEVPWAGLVQMFLLPLPLLPILMIFIIPGLVIFPYLLVVVCIACCCLQDGPIQWMTSGSKKFVVSLLLGRVIPGFIFTTILWQTTYNYSMLLYTGHNWAKIPVFEFNSRSTDCYQSMLVDQVTHVWFSLAALL
eukprot:gene21626-1225_t